MNDRKQKIITGCGFVSDLIRSNKSDSNLYKRAVERLIERLQDDLNDLPIPDTMLAAKEIGLI